LNPKKSPQSLLTELEAQITALHSLLGRLESTAGAASSSEPTAEVDKVSRREQLDYNTVVVGVEWQDPEQKDGVLPFLDNGWNAKEILENLSQHDNDPMTVVTQGCAAVSILSAHIEQGGPAGVSKIAKETHGRMKSQITRLKEITKDNESLQAYLSQASANARDDPKEVLTNFITLEGEIAAIPGHNTSKKTTYQELRRLAHCMKLTVDWDITGATGKAEYGDLASLGDALGSYSGQTYKGWDAAKTLVKNLKTLDQGPFSLILSVPIDDTTRVNRKTKKKENRTKHAVNLGIDKEGKAYLFDPYPRKGKQRLMWDSDQADVRDYFVWPDGKGREWKIKEVLITNTGESN
jgi:hypothetical protein